MINKFYFYLSTFCLLLIAGCSNVQQRINYAAPVNIPNTIREMKTAGFWIDKHPYPDKVILDAKGIYELNTKIEKELNLIINPLNEPPSCSGKALKNDLTKEVNNFSNRKLYTINEKLADKNFYQPIKQNMNLSAIDNNVNIRYGFLTHYANQRLLPTDEILTTEPADFEFDELQNSSLDAGTPLMVLHTSADGLWVYAKAPSSTGWFKEDKVSGCSQDKFKELLQKENFVMIISGKADIFLDENLSKYYDYVRMGARFTFNENPNPEIFEILVPSKDNDGNFSLQKAYIKRADAYTGYLVYTPRNIIEQAFKLFNAPYGWGGMYGEQDCSSYLQEIFATVGINLPRNSAAQGRVGTSLADFTNKNDYAGRIKAIRQKAIPAITILRMNGHVALYLGEYNNKFYIIHETHGYGERTNDGVISRVVNRVIVSDLSLGQGSKKGSLLSRIINVKIIK